MLLVYEQDSLSAMKTILIDPFEFAVQTLF
jgi:hypothetical protein